ncbi:hypothetical protein, partial [Treponema endosymbiont of Eucomonympha sp.]|uniref:hypothetical protein n=1 Tax=Treponema endosymbiont of Eucomonympha sp. TaxID=1580831 RepID=UPI001EE7264A
RFSCAADAEVIVTQMVIASRQDMVRKTWNILAWPSTRSAHADVDAAAEPHATSGAFHAHIAGTVFRTGRCRARTCSRL